MLLLLLTLPALATITTDYGNVSSIETTSTSGALWTVELMMSTNAASAPWSSPSSSSSPPTTRVQHYHEHQGGSSRHGPYFEDGAGPHNVTVRQGSTVLLDCRIGLLQGKTVSWLHRKHDNMQLLTFGRQAYSADQRITLSFRYPGNWRLQISYATRRDQGLYECQIATHPPRALKVYLTVTAPEVVVMDEKGHVVSERYYKAGSAVELTCLATRLDAPADLVLWKLGDRTLTSGVSSNATQTGDTIVSTLTIERALKKHSGNYTCAVGELAASTVIVHVLNGRLPAAVQHNTAPCMEALGLAALVLVPLLPSTSR